MTFWGQILPYEHISCFILEVTEKIVFNILYTFLFYTSLWHDEVITFKTILLIQVYLLDADYCNTVSHCSFSLSPNRKKTLWANSFIKHILKCLLHLPNHHLWNKHEGNLNRMSDFSQAVVKELISKEIIKRAPCLIICILIISKNNGFFFRLNVLSGGYNLGS